MKKKGLIISTIVMVVVLVASLTTATYAWFSSTAEATVENINITTQATSGLQVAVKNGESQYVNGDLSYTNGTWAGTEGWGSLVDFARLTNYNPTDPTASGTLGIWDSAVTRIISPNTIPGSGANANINGKVYDAVDLTIDGTTYVSGSTFTEAALTDLYMYDTAAQSVRLVTGDDSYDAGAQIKYFTANSSVTTGDMLIPIGYSDATGQKVPVGYTVAAKNVDYLDLPISVRSTTDASAIMCSITITPDASAIPGSYAPGMAASAHILVTAPDGSFEFIPYADVTFSNATSQTGTFTFNFIIAYATGTNKIVSTDFYDYNFRIWIEGTDDMCNDLTTGSAFSVDINYSYVAGETALSMDNIDDSGSITSNAGSATGSTMNAITTTGYIPVSGVNYYVGNWTAVVD